MTKSKGPIDPLAEYARTAKKSDAAIGRLIGVSRWKISRGRRGDPPLPFDDQLALEKFTGVTPVQWAEFYSKLAKERGGPDDAPPAPPRKAGAAKKARRPFAASAAEVA